MMVLRRRKVRLRSNGKQPAAKGEIMWIKICGVRDITTACELARLGVDAIGLNFYEKSPRAVTVATAEQIGRALPTAVTAVGLFVNESADRIIEIARRCGFSMLQLHGDEPPSVLAELTERLPNARILRAFRFGEAGIGPLAEYLAECARLQAMPFACLVDAHVRGAYGGTGQTVPWERLAAEYRRDVWPRLILAGGLTPENVRQAIEAARPWGVDTASGVEASPGVKDLQRVAAFVTEARRGDQTFSAAR
ncbi:MAG: phosphoribosylanthranilate isomerase [Planctomycetes bacterium]|nr:phosphoribosylanthranilate isomerase [Planctomycetota bacterium]